MKNPAAQELGRLNKGGKKRLSESERQRRRESLALARLSRHKPKPVRLLDPLFDGMKWHQEDGFYNASTWFGQTLVGLEMFSHIDAEELDISEVIIKARHKKKGDAQ